MRHAVREREIHAIDRTIDTQLPGGVAFSQGATHRQPSLVMRVMGQASTKAAMQHQHPDLEHVRTALNVGRAKPEHESRVN